jgi:hypothetical protein
MRNQSNLVSRLAVAASITLACCAAVADDGRTCSGSYVFSATGWGMPLGVWAPKAIIELIQFNGDGTLIVPAATVANRAGDGQVVASPPNGPGDYQFNPGSCTGTLKFHNGPSFDIFASPKGDELWMIMTNPNNVLEGSVKRISK